MLKIRLSFCASLLVLTALAIYGCQRRSAPPGETPAETVGSSLTDGIDRALDAAAHFLIERQSPDGAWRSDTYGAFRDGGSLTPLVLQTLLHLPQTREIRASVRK